MKSFELLLLIVLVMCLWMVIVKKMPSYLVVPYIALWITILYVAFDRLGKFDKNTTIYTCKQAISEYMTGSSNTDTPDTNDEPAVDEPAVDEPAVSKSTYNTNVILDSDEVTPEAVESNPVYVEQGAPVTYEEIPPPRPILTYDEYKYKQNLFPESSCMGDFLIAEKMKHMGMQAKVSIDANARVDKYTNYGYFAEELDEHSKVRWWDDETLESEF
jgi:hypothetical protein